MKIWGRGKMEDRRERVRRLEIKERRETLWEIDEGEERTQELERKKKRGR